MRRLQRQSSLLVPGDELLHDSNPNLDRRVSSQMTFIPFSHPMCFCYFSRRDRSQSAVYEGTPVYSFLGELLLPMHHSYHAYPIPMRQGQAASTGQIRARVSTDQLRSASPIHHPPLPAPHHRTTHASMLGTSSTPSPQFPVRQILYAVWQ